MSDGSGATHGAAAPRPAETSRDGDGGPARKRPGRGARLASAAIPVLSLVVFVCTWEAIVRLNDIQPFVFPAPSKVLAALQHDLVTPAYWQAVGVTLTEIIVGFLAGSALGIALGTVMALSPLMDRILNPYVVGFQSVPKVAIAPLMIVWFGFGIESKILIVALTAMFPVLVNTIAGLRSTDSDRLDLLRGMCASRVQTLRFVQLPHAMPYIFAGLNTAIVFSVIGAIVGEFVGARQGLGVVILKANFGLDLPAVFSSLVVLGVIGVSLNAAVRAIERRVCFWSGRRQG